MIGVLGHDSVLVRLYWAGDNLRSVHSCDSQMGEIMQQVGLDHMVPAALGNKQSVIFPNACLVQIWKILSNYTWSPRTTLIGNEMKGMVFKVMFQLCKAILGRGNLG